MTLLHTLRNTPWLARLALLWFALTLGVAVASPIVSPQDQQMVCSAAGMIKLVINDDGTVTPGSAAMHCPLCAVGGAPVSYTHLDVYKRQRLKCAATSLRYLSPKRAGASPTSVIWPRLVCERFWPCLLYTSRCV